MNIKVSLPLLFIEKLGGGDCKMGKNYEISTVYPTPPSPTPFQKKKQKRRLINSKGNSFSNKAFCGEIERTGVCVWGDLVMCNTKCTCHYLFYFSRFLMMDRILMVRVTTCIPLL